MVGKVTVLWWEEECAEKYQLENPEGEAQEISRGLRLEIVFGIFFIIFIYTLPGLFPCKKYRSEAKYSEV